MMRWITQHCVGYQRANGAITGAVMSGHVEMTDGSIREAWYIQPSLHIDKVEGSVTYGRYPPAEPVVFECPRVDTVY